MSTPNMGLTQSTPLVTGGPAWAAGIENSLLLVDAHDHTSGKGVLIPVSGLNINADFSLFNYRLINTKSVVFQNQTSIAAGQSLIQSVNGELYFNDGSGTPVQITAAGQVNVSGVGGITGMGGTSAAVTYSNITKTFSFTQSAGKTADIIGGTYYVSEPGVVTANLIGLKSPVALAGSYDITLFSALPGATRIVQLAASGQLLDALDVDNVGVEINANLIRLKANGVTDVNLRQSAALSVVGRSANSTGNVADIQAASDSLVLRRSGTALDFGQVVNAGIADDAISTAKVQNNAVTNVKMGAQTVWIGAASTGSTVVGLPATPQVISAAAVLTNASRAILVRLSPRTYGAHVSMTNNGNAARPGETRWYSRVNAGAWVALTFATSMGCINGTNVLMRFPATSFSTLVQGNSYATGQTLEFGFGLGVDNGTTTVAWADIAIEWLEL